MKGNVHNFPVLTEWGIDITEILDARDRIDIDVSLERLTKGLYLLRSAPDTLLP